MNARGGTPLDVRRAIAQRLAEHRHYAIIMEDVPEEKVDRDALDKFGRILETMGVTDILFYHPPRAKMQAALAELLLLAQKSDHAPVPQLWLLLHVDAAALDEGRFWILERGFGMEYLNAVLRLRPALFPWKTEADLMAVVNHLASEF